MLTQADTFQHGLLLVQAAGQHCVLITHAEEDGHYNVTVCDAIGTPVEASSTIVEPSCVAMTASCIVAASGTRVFVWHCSAAQGKASLCSIPGMLRAIVAVVSAQVDM